MAGAEYIGFVTGKAFIFFACLYARFLGAKKTNQKKGHPSHLSRYAGFPVLLGCDGTLQNSPFGLKQLRRLIRHSLQCSAA